VPPGSYGDQVADLTLELVRQLHYQCRRKGHPMTPGASRPVRLAVDGVVVEGTVPGVHELADGTLAVVAVGTAPHTPRRRALQRTLLCALALAHPGQRVTSFWLGGHPKEPAKTQASRGEVTADHPRSELVSAWEALMALGQEAQYAPRPRFGQTAELLADRPKARRQFHEAVSNLKGWTPEARLYGLNPAFDAVYPQHGEVERFFFALTDVLTRLPSVDTCTAASVHPTWRSRK
jgi:hypothetical protein